MNRPWILLNEAGEPAGGGAPAAVTPPAPAPTGEQTPDWLPGRLARAEEQGRALLLKELGVADPAKAKAAIAAAAKAEEDAKTTGEKLGETTARMTALEQENAELKGAVAVVAKGKLEALSETQRKAVLALAGDDPSSQLIAIEELLPTWATQAAPPAAAPPASPPAGTAPPPNAPPPNGSVSPPDRKAEYLALKAKNPHAAAVFLNHHYAAIYPPTN